MSTESIEEVYEAVVSAVGGAAELASRLDESLSTVCNWRSRGIPARKAKAVEAMSGISVKRIRPDDWQEFWPELVGMEGAPAVEQKAA